MNPQWPHFCFSVEFEPKEAQCCMLGFKNEIILNVYVFGVSQSTEQDNEVKRETTSAIEKLILQAVGGND